MIWIKAPPLIDTHVPIGYRHPERRSGQRRPPHRCYPCDIEKPGALLLAD
jgi:hypothetical protein